MPKTSAKAQNTTERQILTLRAELARLQLQRRNLAQRLNASYDASARNKGTARKQQSAAARQSVHALEMERSQIDTRIDELRQRIDQLGEPAPAQPEGEL
jgi:hypothetical protein